MAFTPRGTGCQVHCLIWFGGDPVVRIGCAHCTFVSKELDLRSTYDDQLTAAAIDSSRTWHARLCTRPSPRTQRPTRRPQASRSYRRAQ